MTVLKYVYWIVNFLCLSEEVYLLFKYKNYSDILRWPKVFAWPVTNLMWLIMLFITRPSIDQWGFKEKEKISK